MGLEEMLRDPHGEKAKKGEVFLQAEELLFCLLFLSRKKVRGYF